MGSGIAQSLALAGYPVKLHDLTDAALEKALETIENGRFGIRKGVELGKHTQDEANAALARLTPVNDIAAATRDVDFVAEVIYEDIAVKIRMFRKLDSLLPPHAIITSNTSGFSIAALGAATDRPEKVAGWHWSSPSQIMKFAEIIVGPETSTDTVDTVVELARECGKNPHVVKDQPLVWGFVGNRIWVAMLREAEQIVREGVATPEQIDELLKDEFRWPVGPFEILGGPKTRNWEGGSSEA